MSIREKWQFLERSALAYVQTDARVRFLGVSAVGFVLDIGLAWGLRHAFDIRLSIAAVISFVTVGIANYAFHEFFTFSRRTSQVNARRILLTFAASALALSCRIAVIEAGTFLWPGPLAELAWLIIGSGASLSVNFFFLQKIVFK